MIRLVLAVLCTLVGLTIAALVISALAVVGTDDVTQTQPFTVQDEAYAVLLDQQLVPYEGTSAQITAAGDQELFIGTANGVDTEDFFAGVAHEVITEVDFSSQLSHRFVPGEPAPVVGVTTRNWFLDSSTGTTVTHRFDLSAEPQVVVIAPVDPQGSLEGVSVQMAMDVRGVFAFCMLGAGLAALAFGLAAFFFLRWWNSRLLPPPEQPAGSTRAAAGRRPNRRTPTLRRVGGSLAGASAMVLALSGCALLPIAQPQPPNLIPYERPALRPGDAGEFLTSYTEQLDATLEGDQQALDQVQTGPLLARTRAEVLIAGAEDQTLSAVNFTEVMAGGPMFGEYPMWFIGFGDPGDSDTVQAMLATRESASQEWKVAQSLFVPREVVPTLLVGPEGAVPRAPESHQDVAAAAAEQLVGFLETGEKPESELAVEYPTDTFTRFREYVDRFSDGDESFDEVTVECEPYTGIPLSTLTLETESGAVSLGEVQCTIAMSVPGDFSIDMGTAVEAVMTSEGEGSAVQIETSLPYLLTEAEGTSAVTGSDWFLLSSQTTGG